MDMFTYKYSALVLIFCTVTSSGDRTIADQEELDSLTRQKRYGVGRWHRPFYYNNNHNHWSKEAPPNWSDTRVNNPTKPNYWPNTMAFTHNNVAIGGYRENKIILNQTKYNTNGYEDITRQDTKPNFKLPYFIEKDSNSTSHWGYKPNIQLPSITKNYTNSTPHWGHIPNFHLPRLDHKKDEHELTFTTSQFKPNFNHQYIKYNTTGITFNRTNIISKMDQYKFEPNVITTYLKADPNAKYQTKPEYGNKTNLGQLKIDETHESRKSLNVLGTKHMTHLNISPNATDVKNNNNKNNDSLKANNEEIDFEKYHGDLNLWINPKKGNNEGMDVWRNNPLTNVGNTNMSVTDDIMTSPFRKLDVPTPDFRAPGMRISESKCYEYLWYMKKRIDDSQRKLKRDAFIRNRGVLVSKIFAIDSPHTVIPGRDTSPGEFPHMGALGWKAKNGTWIFKCGSTLISHKFVLTAAHCSKSPPDPAIAYLEPKIVRLGDKNILDVLARMYYFAMQAVFPWNSLPTDVTKADSFEIFQSSLGKHYFANDHEPFDVNILKIIVHPKYSSPKQYYDIALVELEKEVEFTKYVHPACLWTNSDTNKLVREATVTGWGVIETAGLTTSPELQAAVVDILDTDKCNQLLKSSCNRNWCGFRDHQICAGKLAGGVDTCQGDSGGPLQVKIPLPTDSQGNMHFVIGVISFGVKCAVPQLPGIYSRVTSFLDWIEKIVWPLD